MPINTVGPRLGKSVTLRSAKGLLKRGKKGVSVDLNLTSMVDMLTILTVFLLQTFSASGEILFVQRNIQLPDALNWKDLERAPVVGVSNESVTLDGRPLADVTQLTNDAGVDNKIAPLHDDLVTLKNNFKLTHQGSDQFDGLVIVQSDKGVDFKILKKVMYTCALAGYANINFAVQQRAKPGGAAP
jgi:biopolymer transport protein ExbD